MHEGDAQFGAGLAIAVGAAPLIVVARSSSSSALSTAV
jgi:hypothetical protein